MEKDSRERKEHETTLIHELTSNGTTAKIDGYGAFVNELVDEESQIFFPKGNYTNESGQAKVRGGCHPCFPNFGPADVKYDLPQHGLAREVNWDEHFVGDDEIHLHKEIDGVATHIFYKIEEKSFSADLVVENRSSEAKPIAPGFHPYFDMGSLCEFTINGQTYDLDKDAEELADTIYIDSVMTLQIGDKIINFENEHLDRFAIWSGGEMDKNGDRYICIEPTAEGASFENGNNPSLIQPGHGKAFRFGITW